MTSIGAHALRLEKLVCELARPGGRMVGTAGHGKAEAWSRVQLGALRLRPYAGADFALPFTRDRRQFTNFAGVIPGRNRRLPPLLIGAHYDSVIAHPCADDNAAAVAIALSSAAQLASRQRERDIVVALFDSEEPPYFRTAAMGSVAFCAEQSDARGFHAALILDLVGHDIIIPSLGEQTPAVVRNLLFVQGAESHPALARIIANDVQEKNLSVVAALNSYRPDKSDHYAFRQRQVPYLFFSCGEWPHYHAPSDTPEKLNYRKMARITQRLVALTDAVASARLSGPVPAGDFSATVEAASIRRAFGGWVQRLGFKTMSSRDDVNAFAAYLLAAIHPAA